jgi:urease accessory protein
MLRIKAKLKVAKGAYKVEVRGRLPLSFAERSGPAQATLESGEAVELALPRGEVLRGGDLATASDGRIVEIVARPERLLRLQGSAAALARAAYALGSAHVPVEFRDDHLRVGEHSVPAGLLAELGLQAASLEAPFEAEVRSHAEPHGQAHVHDEHCGHEHHHHGHRH